MRLWHKNLLSVLPRLQLVSQYRECCCIAKSIAEKGTPNHILVNRIMDYPLNHFASYTAFVIAEMRARGYKVNSDKFWKWMSKTDWCSPDFIKISGGLFEGWHNDRYLRQCLLNLQEKYDCDGIPADEWQVICERFEGYVEE